MEIWFDLAYSFVSALEIQSEILRCNQVCRYSREREVDQFLDSRSIDLASANERRIPTPMETIFFDTIDTISLTMPWNQIFD